MDEQEIPPRPLTPEDIEELRDIESILFARGVDWFVDEEPPIEADGETTEEIVIATSEFAAHLSLNRHDEWAEERVWEFNEWSPEERGLLFWGVVTHPHSDQMTLAPDETPDEESPRTTSIK